MFSFKVYFAKRREQKRIAQQYALEKKNVVYFKTSVSCHTGGSLEDFSDNINLLGKGVYMIGGFKKTSFPIQAVRLLRLWEGGKLVLSYGDYPYRYSIKWLTPIENLPEELWFHVEDYPRPTRPALLLCDYGSDHYEVVEYENKVWGTELSFPAKPTRYFVLDFLKEDKLL